MPARNVLHVLSRFQHAGQIIKSRIRIGTAHGLNKSSDRIVVIVPGLIVTDCLLLYTFLCHLQCDMDLSIASRVCGKNGEFYGV